MPRESALPSLEADLRILSAESRRSESLTGQLTGWLAGPEHPQIKESAERAMLKLRTLGNNEDPEVLAKHRKEILKPFLAACGIKSPKLASISLASIQKMLANDLVAQDDIQPIVLALGQVERLRDEGVQLKILQTALTLMQSPLLAEDEDAVAAVLGICFRLFADPKNADSVVNTAATTVRQAVALVFEHVDIEGARRGSITGSTPASPKTPMREHRSSMEGRSPLSRANSTASAPHSPASTLLAEHGPDNAALKLLDNLCMMITANSAMLVWLKAPALPRPFVLDLLDFVLGNSAAVFRELPAFEHALLVRVCTLLTTQLQNLLDPACEPALQASDLRVVLRTVRTVLHHFYRQLRSKCGVFIDTLLAGTTQSRTLWQRINVMQVMRQLSQDAHMMHFLFCSYDMRQDCKLNAMTDMVQSFASIVESTSRLGSDAPEDDTLHAVAALYQSRANSREWSLDLDYGSASAETGIAYLAMLGIDSLLGIVAAVEKLTDMAVDGVTSTQEQGPAALERDTVERGTCEAMIALCWHTVLSALSQLLAHTSGEALVVQLLKGYQSMTQACGMLELKEQQDAFLTSLCRFTLTDAADSDHPAGSRGEAAATTSGKGRLPRVDSGFMRSPPSDGEASARPAEQADPRDIARAGSATIPRGGSGMVIDAGEGPGKVLTAKNVHALRTLFNVAHKLHPLLGSSWLLVLENLNSLDRILNSPRTTTQEASSSSSTGSLPSDLAILSVAANQLFESTSNMGTETVVNILAGLRLVSNRALPSAAQLPGQPKLFALSRMVDVLLYNLTRVHDLWPLLLDHIVELLSDSKAPVRTAAVDALGRALTGTLAACVSQASQPGDRAESNGAASDWGATEHMLLMALESLYKDSEELDVRLGLLRVLLQILQRHGEQLSTGWDPILRILEAVPEAEEAASVGLAFQSVQLLASDYMSSLPPSLLRKCLEVAALYGAQQADVNVSLTAMGLLWNAADLLSKMQLRSEAASGQSDAPVLSSDNFEELLRLLLGALQGLSTDTRPEVRNSGVRTLFAVVASQGTRFSHSVWEECLWQMLFPLLRSVHHTAATSSREEAAAEILGKVRGERVAMLVHHSRNSVQKQWEETLVLALGGMARILRAHLPILVPMPGFSQGWEELMLVVESAMAGARKEVALAAIGVITTVVGAHGAGPAMTRAMWKRALRAMGVGVEAAVSPNCMVPLMARLELVAAIGQLHGTLHTVMEEGDVTDMYVWLERLAKNPYTDDELRPVVPGTLPPVQKAVFTLLTSMAPVELPQLWPDLIDLLLNLLKPHQLQPSEPANAPDTAAGTSSTNVNKHALSALSMEKVVDILAQLYRDQAPWQARADTFAQVVAGLGACMVTRFSCPEENLWRAAAEAFNCVVAAGLPAVNIAYVNAEEDPPEQAWPSLAASFSAFLLGSHLPTGAPQPSGHEGKEATSNGGVAEVREAAYEGSSASQQEQQQSAGERHSDGGESLGRASRRSSMTEQDSEQARRDADLEAAVLDTLTDSVLTACTCTPPDVVEQFVAIVDGGTVRPLELCLPASGASSRFSQLCLRKMYVLCSRGAEASSPQGCLLQVAQIALPVFLRRVKSILREYRTSKNADRLQLENCLCCLDTLAAMTLSPAVTDVVLPPGSRLKALVRARRPDGAVAYRERAHLLILYEDLVACVASRELRVRTAVQALLTLAGEELGLVPKSSPASPLKSTGALDLGL
ncbi:Protein MON2 homolog [Coccomyxa sp. Obi]|nr:Protein MON2 homolog [Coccomyxa sp. Obi]